MTRTALPSARTGRQMIVDILTNGQPRTADLQATVAAIAARWAIVGINPATFGLLNRNAGNNLAQITVGTDLLEMNDTLADPMFSAADVGKTVHVQGAGVAGATLVAVILGIQPGNKAVTIDRVAPTGVTAKCAIWGWPITDIANPLLCHMKQIYQKK